MYRLFDCASHLGAQVALCLAILVILCYHQQLRADAQKVLLKVKPCRNVTVKPGQTSIKTFQVGALLCSPARNRMMLLRLPQLPAS
jgi:hypothetical protein